MKIFSFIIIRIEIIRNAVILLLRSISIILDVIIKILKILQSYVEVLVIIKLKLK